MSHTMATLAGRAVALILIAGLAGCAGSQKSPQQAAKAKPGVKSGNAQLQQIAYAPPDSESPLPPSLDTAQSTWDIEQQIAANVGAIPDATLGASRAGTIMTILYSGDPRDFVDCGEISIWAAEDTKPKVMKASEDKLKLARTTRKPDGLLERTLQLDSRTTVRFSGLPGGSTRVDVHARYVVTKEVHSFAFGGGKDGKNKWLGAKRETIAFNTGERRSFSVGTTCVGTGKLEQTVLAGVGSQLQVVAPVPPVVASPTTKAGLLQAPTVVSPVAVREVQMGLYAYGYYAGAIDGMVGPDMQAALGKFQADYGLKVTGTVTPEVVDALGIATE